MEWTVVSTQYTEEVGLSENEFLATARKDKLARPSPAMGCPAC